MVAEQADVGRVTPKPDATDATPAAHQHRVREQVDVTADCGGSVTPNTTAAALERSRSATTTSHLVPFTQRAVGGHGERSVERLVGPVPSRDRPHGPHRRPHQGGEHQPHSQRAHRCVTCAADTEGHTRTSTTPRDAIDTFGLLARCGRDIAGGFELAADAGEPLGEPGPLRYGPGGSARCTATPDGLHRRIRLAPLHVTVPTAAPPTPNDPSAAAERRGFSSASEQSAAQAEPSRDREHDPRIPPGRGITLRRLGTGFAAETF